MNGKNTPSEPTGPSAGQEERSPALVSLMNRIAELLQAGKPKVALDTISRATPRSNWVDNAIGVCNLRLGRPQQALDVFRGLALGPGGIVLRADAPVVFKANFASALLATNNFSGFMKTLADLRDEQHPSVQKLRDRVAAWTAGFTFWQKVKWNLGLGQPVPFPIDPDLGDLE